MAVPASADPLKLVWDDITNKSACEHAGSEERFLPHTELEKLLSEEEVLKILEQSLPQLKLHFPRSDALSDIEALASWVVPNSIKIFATLVMIEQPWLIESFRIHGKQRDTGTASSRFHDP